MKRIIVLLLIFVLCIPCISIYSAPIYSYEDTVPIARGITLTRVKDFYADHLLTYSVIKADLSDGANSLKLLTPEGGIDTFATVANLAKTEKDTVAALNADFFSLYKGSKGFSLGIEIKDGELLQSPINPTTMATVAYDDSLLSMSYLDFHIMAVAPNWQYNEIRHLNKHTSYYGDILMYTSDFNGGYSPAPGGVVVEVVVEDGKIKEFRRNMPPVKIPENGCVLVVSEGVNMFLANNFNVGDEIKFDYYITPDISDAEAAFGGGAMLVSNGNVVKNFSHVISGTHPRSAIGVDKSGKIAYLVAVDGRQSTSRGMSMSEMANLMASLGCYNAVNLDGGGSTSMVASTSWDKNLTTVNSPSETRKVSNAVGIISEFGDSSPSSVLVKGDRDVVFVGDYIKISTSVLNSNMHPLDKSATLWSDHGTFMGEYFSPAVSGTVTVNASCDEAYGSADFYAIDKIAGINLKNYIQIPIGGTANLGITVFDSEGRNVAVENTSKFHITSSDSSVVSVNGQTLTGHKNGSAIITVSKDGATSYASVNVGSGGKSVTNSFDKLEGSFVSYPSYVDGSVEVSSERSVSNGASIQLCYDFSTDNAESKAAYYALSPKIKLDNSCNDISVKVFSPGAFNHSVRAQFTDGNGDVFRVKMCENLSGGEWTSIVASIPAKAARPITLDRIYALYTDGEAKDSGCIYLDDLSYTVASGDSKKFIAAPLNVYETANFPSSSPTFRIGSRSFAQKTLLTTLVDTKMAQAVNGASTSMLLGNTSPFSKKEDSHAIYITLDTSKGGIKATNSSQWNSLANAIAYTKKENVFIISDYSLFGNDAFENSVIMDYLASLYKNIYVITGGDRNTYTNIGGVSYFTLANTEKEELSADRVNNYSYLEFSLSGKPTFRWVKLFK
ncbi:MAG: phosphodiester glycosidase family protein [Clostridia bacterium]|nr:phosphodiester glycosidase family protein [Clostridia bacterium]